ncbi:MAG: autoinducer binding domain-containing protein [Salibaculum sp.]|jgi:LuxR family transcriptional regulator|uniref:autoinducer binding domain-containing protein n=1 Tax=Roseovarius halophilus (ex Wu et al. 2025) TaxID=3376060 RepID=UPI0028707960|nr:autoinducer binding domain-containing protein [Salibaculum sp.]MDR9428733.1 autoinducer binding domain-containing protein [Salibaculum sp.]MDR9483120.1 autoinducer binding domain-containing protein [Salibaculum sp.]
MADKQDIRTVLVRLENQSPTGFAIAFHIKFTTPEFLLQTYPKDWIDLYSERGYVMSDPIVRWGFSETGVMSWADLATWDDAGVLAESERFGMKHGVAISIEAEGTRSVAGFARSDRDFTGEEVARLKADVEALHRMTSSADGMNPTMRKELHELSVQMTHPGSSE